MLKRIKRFLVGRPLKNEALDGEKYGVLWGLPILSSDAISSVAYAGQEILLVLIPVIGLLAYSQLGVIAAIIIGILAILVINYLQTIDNYPSGGGAYVVAKDNINVGAGMVAGVSLLADYVITVAVSLSSGVEQIMSAVKIVLPDLHFLTERSVLISISACILLILILMIGNLRGLKESARLFGIPAYAFIFGMVSMLIVGFVKFKSGYIPPEPTGLKPFSAIAPLSLILLLRAFSGGCTALTGIESISNAIPNFKNPSTKYAKKVLLLLATIIIVLFGGTAFMANIYHVVPGDKAMLVLMAEQVFGNSFMLYFITITTFIILVLAANTPFTGFPLLISVMAKDGYAPRQLTMRGDRLSYDNGIVLLSITSMLLIIIFKANVSALVKLYGLGIFASFTLSQAAMCLKWWRERGKKWKSKLVMSGLGTILTLAVVISISTTKFMLGAWIVVLVIPILSFLMFKVKKHYIAIYKQLRIKPEEFETLELDKVEYRNRVIVPIEGINKSSIRALRYAKTISDNIVAFSVTTSQERAEIVKQNFERLNSGIPIVIKYSPFRKVVEPLLKFIESAEYDYQKGDMITVIVPQFAVKKWWHKFLHNNTGFYVEKELLKHKHIVISVMPLQLKSDEFVLKNPKYQ